MVKLASAYPGNGSAHTPVWGGPRGYVAGLVFKTHTHDPDQSKHQAMVRWTNNHTAGIEERYLERLDEDDKVVEHDFRHNLPLHRDIWAVVRDSKGALTLHVVEPNTFMADRTEKPYTVTLTPCEIDPKDIGHNYTLINKMLMSPGAIEIKRPTLFSAMMEIYTHAKFELPKTIPLPLPEYETVKAAVEAIPDKDGAGVALFHLPKNMAEYTCCSEV